VIRTKIPLFLDDDIIGHLDWMVEQLSRQKDVRVSRSEAVTWLVKKHQKKIKVTKQVPSKAIEISA